MQNSFQLYKDLTLAKLHLNFKKINLIETQIKNNQDLSYNTTFNENKNYIEYYNEQITQMNNKLINNELNNNAIEEYLHSLDNIYNKQKDKIFYLKNNFDISLISTLKIEDSFAKNCNIVIPKNEIYNNSYNFPFVSKLKSKNIYICTITYINSSVTLNLFAIYEHIYDNYRSILGSNVTDFNIADLAFAFLIIYYYYIQYNTFNITSIINNYLIKDYNITDPEDIKFIIDYYSNYLVIINKCLLIYPNDIITKQKVKLFM
jgi:hypothetical protein